MIVFTATELADAIGVQPKAFRSFVRSMVRTQGGKVGEQTPGSGGRYRFECDDDDESAFVARWADAYKRHARTNNTRAIVLSDLLLTHAEAHADDESDEGDDA
jgi:hypothetical protein